MCGRYASELSWDELRQIFEPLVRPADAPNLEPDDDVRPTTRQWIARPADDGMEMVRARWGLIPFWWKGASTKEFKLTTFNAKSEGVATASTFREAFKRRRCLVPASGWFEWTGPKGSKAKWRFTPKGGGTLTFAGLWDRCQIGEETVESFTIVTQPAGSPLNGYHDRAPVVIAPDGRRTWLDLQADVSGLLGPESVDSFDVRAA